MPDWESESADSGSDSRRRPPALTSLAPAPSLDPQPTSTSQCSPAHCQALSGSLPSSTRPPGLGRGPLSLDLAADLSGAPPRVYQPSGSGSTLLPLPLSESTFDPTSPPRVSQPSTQATRLPESLSRP
eukprot:1984675-Rhodomonas_salina.2